MVAHDGHAGAERDRGAADVLVIGGARVAVPIEVEITARVERAVPELRVVALARGQHDSHGNNREKAPHAAARISGDDPTRRPARSASGETGFSGGPGMQPSATRSTRTDHRRICTSGAGRYGRPLRAVKGTDSAAGAPGPALDDR